MRPIVPHKRDSCRIAAIALYRALLSQTSAAVRLTSDERDNLRNAIRHRFGRNRHLVSRHLLVQAYETGSEILDHLDSSIAGNDQSTTLIRDTLSSLPSYLTQPKALPAKRDLSPEALKSQPYFPDPGFFFRQRPRPLSELKGPRKVPVLVSASLIPMLRFGKPQPQGLSKYLKQRLQRKQSRVDRRHYFEEMLEIAEREDQWDTLIETELSLHGTPESWNGARAEREGDVNWADAVNVELENITALFRADWEKNRDWAERMQDLVDAETELAEKEREERRRERRESRDRASMTDP